MENLTFTPTPEPIFLTVAQAAVRMGMSEDDVRILCKTGSLPGAKQERKRGPWRIPAKAVDDWIRQQVASNTHQPEQVLVEPVAEPLPSDSSTWWERLRNHPSIVILTILVAIVTFIGVLISSGADFGPFQQQLREWGICIYCREFASASDQETLIVIATFHITTATNAEPHVKIQRAIEAAAAQYGETNLRARVESTELNADQREQAEKLGKFYNASMVIWGEDTGVQSIVNFINLKEPNYDTLGGRIEENEHIQLSDSPAPYAQFITHDLPQEMTFLALFAIAQSHYMKGLYYSQQSQTSDANQEYVKAIVRIETGISTLSPEKLPEVIGDAYFRLGWLYQQSPANLNDAIEYYTKAMQYKPQLVGAYMNRGNAYYDLDYFSLAIGDYSKAISIKPDLVRAYINRGNAYYYNQKVKPAIDNYNEAIKLDPNDEDVRGNLNIALDTLKKLEDGLARNNEAIANNPDDVNAYLDRAVVHYALGNMTAAIEDFTKVINLNPSNFNIYINRGIAFRIMDKDVEAIADFSKSIELNPNEPRTFSERGQSYRKLGKLQEALSDFRHCLELLPNADDNPVIQQWAAEVEAELARQK